MFGGWGLPPLASVDPEGCSPGSVVTGADDDVVQAMNKRQLAISMRIADGFAPDRPAQLELPALLCRRQDDELRALRMREIDLAVRGDYAVASARSGWHRRAQR